MVIYMKGASAVCVTVVFFSIAVLAFVVMGRAGDPHASCFAETATGAVCPKDSGAFAVALFHIAAFKSFSTAILDSAAAVLAVAVLFLAGAAVYPLTSALAPGDVSFVPQGRLRRRDVSASVFAHSFSDWLTRHIASPTRAQ